MNSVHHETLGGVDITGKDNHCSVQRCARGLRPRRRNSYPAPPLTLAVKNSLNFSKVCANSQDEILKD
jgi:hypothetical protein